MGKNQAIAIILAVYFLFTSGAVFELAQVKVTDRFIVPFSYALSGAKLGLIGVYNNDDIVCARWLADESDKTLPIVGDYNTRRLLASFLPQVPRLYLNGGYTRYNYKEKCYVFYTTWNVENQIYIGADSLGLRQRDPLPDYGLPIVFQQGNSIVYIQDKE